MILKTVKKGRLILLVLAVLLLAGCWNRKEPKLLAIVNSIVYDIEESGQYRVIIEFINSSESGGSKQGGSGGKESPNLTATGKGDSPRVALSDVSRSVEKIIFGGHNKVRFFTERFARTDMLEVFDYLLRDHLTDETSFVVVIKGEEPEQLYTCMLGLSKTVGDFIDDLSSFQSSSIAKGVFITTLSFARDHFKEGKQPVAGVVSFEECESKPSENEKGGTDDSSGPGADGQEKKLKIVYEGLAAFKENKLVGYFSGEETRAYNFITNSIGTSHITAYAQEDKSVLEIISSKSKVKTKMKDGKAVIDVNIKAEMWIIGHDGTIDIMKADQLKIIEESCNKKIEQEISAAVQKAQKEFQSDIFGFGEYMHIQNPGEWKDLKENWDDYFSKAEINVSVESKIIRTGETKYPLKLEN